jgi:hypothetical protein
MRFRKLRITWTVLCGIACVLLIVLWVRSYQRTDYVCTPLNRNQGVWGQFVLGMIGIGTTVYPPPESKMTTTELNTEDMKFAVNRWRSLYPYGFGVRSTANSRIVMFPFWLAVVCSAAFATGPWIRQLSWRFSLRTLLIATTIIAVVLGLVVYLARG